MTKPAPPLVSHAWPLDYHPSMVATTYCNACTGIIDADDGAVCVTKKPFVRVTIDRPRDNRGGATVLYWCDECAGRLVGKDIVRRVTP
jgi:hypothetical protein